MITPDEMAKRQKKKPDVVCIGQAVVDCITRGAKEAPDQKLALRAESVHLSTGGDAVNESFVLAGLGYDVHLVCGLGQDYAGMILLEEAKRRGVGTSRIQVIEGMDTPIANLIVNEDGSRRSINSRATMLEAYTPDESAVRDASIVSFASLFRAPLDQKDIVCRLIRAAHEDGAVICADTKLPTFRKLTLEDLKEVLPLIDYIFPNEKEAAYHTGEEDFARAAEVFHGYGIRHVIIKAGPLGCFVSVDEGAGRGGCRSGSLSGSGEGTSAAHRETFYIPALSVQAVDTTGAGDNFVAGFISGLLEGEDLNGCCTRAMRQAAMSIRHIGGV